MAQLGAAARGARLAVGCQLATHGQFLPWIAAEFEMSEDAAQRFMAVAHRFGEIPQIAVFKPSILYALSAPDSVVEKALCRMASGCRG